MPYKVSPVSPQAESPTHTKQDFSADIPSYEAADCSAVQNKPSTPSPPPGTPRDVPHPEQKDSAVPQSLSSQAGLSQDAQLQTVQKSADPSDLEIRLRRAEKQVADLQKQLGRKDRHMIRQLQSWKVETQKLLDIKENEKNEGIRWNEERMDRWKEFWEKLADRRISSAKEAEDRRISFAKEMEERREAAANERITFAKQLAEQREATANERAEECKKDADERVRCAKEQADRHKKSADEHMRHAKMLEQKVVAWAEKLASARREQALSEPTVFHDRIA
ncbi:hypothetical protein BDW22DRAFT_1432416 [Trametopsis cervina]|nr:hypothetical protein BDW22DRAFT_1432416 [Trametopsis cervina]